MHTLSHDTPASRPPRWGRLLGLLLGSGLCATAYAVDPGDLDTTFSSDGIVLTDLGNTADRGEAVLVQLDGKIVVAGSSRLGTNTAIAVARYDFDGSLDTDFDLDGILTTPIGSVDDAAFAVTIQADQKILVGGQSWNGADFDFALVRYEADGSLDTSFGINADGIVTTGFQSGSDDGAFAIALQSDGKILLAGFTASGGDEDFALARYDTDGTLDLSFGNAGLVTTDIVGFPDGARAMVVQADGRILLAGSAFNNNADEDVAVVRYQTNGSLDTAFGTGGRVIIDFVSSDEGATGVALQDNGRIVLSGFTSSGGDGDFLALRLLVSGSPDTTFGPAGTGSVITDLGGLDDLASGVAIQSDGKILLSGLSNNGGADQFALVRYESNGALDTTFGTGGSVLTSIGAIADAGQAITLQPDGRIVLAGFAETAAGSDIAVARYRAVSGPDAIVGNGSGGGCTLSAQAPFRDTSLLLLVSLLFVLRVARR